MKQEQYMSMEFNDKRTLSDTMSIISNFMANDTEKYKEDLLDHTKVFMLQSTNPKKVKSKLGKSAGRCITRPRNIVLKFFKPKNIKRYQARIYVNDTITNDYHSNMLISLHEMNHADTSQYANNIGKNYYSGFRIHTLYPFIMGVSDGEGLNESINELYTQIQFFENYPKLFENINSIDQLIYNIENPIFKKNITPSGDLYRKLWPFVKLLILVCDNNPCITYESLKNDGIPFIEKKVTLNDKEVYKNDLLYAGKKNCIEFQKEYDEIMGKGQFVKLLKSFDKLLYELKNQKKMKIESVNKTINLIDNYKTHRYDKLVKDGLLTTTKKAIYEYKYNCYKSKLTYTYKLK